MSSRQAEEPWLLLVPRARNEGAYSLTLPTPTPLQPAPNLGAGPLSQVTQKQGWLGGRPRSRCKLTGTAPRKQRCSLRYCSSSKCVTNSTWAQDTETRKRDRTARPCRSYLPGSKHVRKTTTSITGQGEGRRGATRAVRPHGTRVRTSHQTHTWSLRCRYWRSNAIILQENRLRRAETHAMVTQPSAVG